MSEKNKEKLGKERDQLEKEIGNLKENLGECYVPKKRRVSD